VREMKPGSVIVDLAADMGGNCALTQAGGEVTHHGVTILGPVRLASTLPVHASQMYSRNIAAFLLHLTRDAKLHLDWSDEITRMTCITHEGRIVHEPTRERVEGAAAGAAAPSAAAAPARSPS